MVNRIPQLHNTKIYNRLYLSSEQYCKLIYSISENNVYNSHANTEITGGLQFINIHLDLTN